MKGAGLYIPKTIITILVKMSVSIGYRQCDLIVIVFTLGDEFFPHYDVPGICEDATAPNAVGRVDATKVSVAPDSITTLQKPAYWCHQPQPLKVTPA